ncbi:hypothetical protein Pth03_75140 [Planotetraspora thailandica]|uniref:Uncharacterized protein n=1 Tax=Planotetraspora thailandica TaxID=487172 RepID=A0A8J3Y1Q0_9ACTN|nr:hypothetical protein [Planotetraspora thailandica]GII59125.1 hypothetical protein Pth03_75140 [Planotetraspora thailandica]
MLVAVAFLLLLHLWGLRIFGFGVIDYQRFGDVGSWAQGIGTVAAVAVAFRQIKQQEAARLDDIARQDRRERTQVFCWMSFLDDDSQGQLGWYLCFNNLTPLPINAWTLTVRERGTGKQVGKLDVTHLDPIAPGFSRIRTRIPVHALTEPVCELDFVDLAGECWRRSSLGPLAYIPEVTIHGQVAGRSEAVRFEAD